MHVATTEAAAVLPEAGARTILAICLVSGLAGQGFLLSPIFLGALAEHHGFGAVELGYIAAAGGAGGLLAGVTSPAWLPFAPLRRTAAASVLVSVASLMLFLAISRSSAAAMCVMALHGLAMGVLYTLIFGAVSLYAHPEKTLGWKIGTEGFPGLAMLYVISNLVAPTHGFPGVVTAMAGSELLLALAIGLLPAGRPRPALAPATARRRLPRAAPGVWPAVAATVLLWTGVNGVWTFLERIGVAHGMPLTTIGLVLTLGWLFASAGSLAAGLVGGRLGMIRPFLASIGLGLAALPLLLQASALSYGLAANLFLVATSFAMIFPIAAITAFNTHPAFAGAGAVALQAAGVVGPAVGGYLYGRWQGAGVSGFAAVCFAASVAAFLVAHRQAVGSTGRAPPPPSLTVADSEAPATHPGEPAARPTPDIGPSEDVAGAPPTYWRPFASGIAD